MYCCPVRIDKRPSPPAVARMLPSGLEECNTRGVTLTTATVGRTPLLYRHTCPNCDCELSRNAGAASGGDECRGRECGIFADNDGAGRIPLLGQGGDGAERQGWF